MSPRTTPVVWSLFAVVLLAAGPFSVRGHATESAAEPLKIGQRHTLESKILGESRTVRVALPEGYEDSDQRCGVVYLIDGHSLFWQAAGSVRHLRGFLPLIVVGIDNPDATRTRDLTPPNDAIRVAFPGSQGSHDFRRFLVDELRPFVDANYRTNGVRLLVGHSFGGLFVLDSMLEEPHAFGGYLALSPSVWWDEGSFVERMGAVSADHGLFERFAYFSIGDEWMNAQFDDMTSSLESRASSGFRWEVDHFPGMNHWAVAHPALYAGLSSYIEPVVRAEAEASTFAELTARFEALEAVFGESVPLETRSILGAAEATFVRGEGEKAVQIVLDAIEQRPRETKFYLWLGEGYEDFGLYSEAIALYEKGIALFGGDAELGSFAEELRDRRDLARKKAAVVEGAQ